MAIGLYAPPGSRVGTGMNRSYNRGNNYSMKTTIIQPLSASCLNPPYKCKIQRYMKCATLGHVYGMCHGNLSSCSEWILAASMPNMGLCVSETGLFVTVRSSKCWR